MSTFELFDLVALQRDVADKNLRVGDVGTVVELLNGPAVVVEFVEASGDTRAVMTLEEADLQKVEPNEMLAVRSAIRGS
jgi:Domain of unknown function (DUF4926)